MEIHLVIDRKLCCDCTFFVQCVRSISVFRFGVLCDSGVCVYTYLFLSLKQHHHHHHHARLVCNIDAQSMQCLPPQRTTSHTCMHIKNHIDRGLPKFSHRLTRASFYNRCCCCHRSYLVHLQPRYFHFLRRLYLWRSSCCCWPLLLFLILFGERMPSFF